MPRIGGENIERVRGAEAGREETPSPRVPYLNDHVVVQGLQVIFGGLVLGKTLTSIAVIPSMTRNFTAKR
jgi:hypothetical protein